MFKNGYIAFVYVASNVNSASYWFHVTQSVLTDANLPCNVKPVKVNSVCSQTLSKVEEVT